MIGKMAMVIAPLVLLLVTTALIGYVKLRHSAISLERFKDPIERGIAEGLGGVKSAIDEAVLTLTDSGALELQLKNLELSEPDGDSVVTVPVASVDLDLRSLLMLSVVPKRVYLIGPRLNVSYSDSKGVALTIATGERLPEAEASSAAAPAADVEPSKQSQQPRASPFGVASGRSVSAGRLKLDVVRWLNDSAAKARSGEVSGAGLREIGVRNATVLLDYEGRKSQWQVVEATVDLEHRKQRSVLSGSARFAGEKGPWALSLRSETRPSRDSVDVSVNVRDMVPAVIARAIPDLAALERFEMPMALDMAAELSGTGDVRSAKLDLALDAARAGSADAPGSPVSVEAGLIQLVYDASRREIALKPSTLRSGESHITLSGYATTVMGVSGRPQWRYDIKSDGGELATGAKGETAKIDSFTAGGVVVPETGEFRLDGASLAAGEAKLSLAGVIEPGPQGAVSRFEGRMGAMPIQGLKLLWPAGIAPDVRKQLLSSVTRGRILSGTMRMGNDPGSPQPGSERTSASLELADLSIATAAGAPPVDVPRALVRIENSSAEVTVPEATITAGPQKTISLKGGRFTAVDVSGSGPVGELEFRLNSTVPAMLAIAAHPNLKLLGDNALPLVEGVDGKVEGTIKVNAPLSTPNAQPKVEGKVRLSEVRLLKPVGAVNVQGGTLDISMSEQAIDTQGDLLLNGVIAKLAWQYIFDAQPDKQPPMRITARLDNSDRNQLGLDVNHVVQGDVPIEVSVTLGAGGAPATHVRADLTGAELYFRDAAWKKPPGRSAFLDFDVKTGTAHPIELQNLKIAGDNIAIEGWAAIDKNNDMSEFYFPDFSLNVISRLEVRGTLGTDKVWRIKAKGPTYDAREFFSSIFSLGSANENRIRPLRPAAGMDVEADIANVLGHNEVSLRNTKLRVSERADKLTALSAEGLLDGEKPVLAILKRDASSNRVMFAESADAGRAFKLAGFYKNLIGGRVRLEVNLEGRGAAEKSGVLWVENFRVLGDPVVTEVIASASGSGSSDKQRVVREVYDFDRMRVPFAAGHDQFVLEDSYLRGPIVGATIKGKVDFASSRVDLGGTYIPLQGINSALCAIPLLGAIITGPKCEGVVGITYAIQGPMSRPQVLVNPLSMFTPGILREIMQMTDPNLKVQARESKGSKVPAQQRTGNSSSEPVRAKSDTRPAERANSQPIDGWTSQTTPNRR